MNSRKPILYILLTVMGLILIYNYILGPILMQYSTQFSMGMHGRIYNNNYFIDMRYVLLIIIIIVGFILYDLIKPKSTISKCRNCGKHIESDRWKICPVCGTPIKNGRGDSK